jgi:membrane protein DedA with SNARE-associated domain
MTHIAQLALTHGAALLFTWILLQQAGVPIPTAPLLIVVGSLVSNGRLRLVPSLVTIFTACLLADGFWYRVGRRGKSKSHRVCRPKGDWKSRVLSLVWHHSGASILVAKFVAGSNVVSLLAGQSGLSAARFLVYDSIGALTWSGSYIALGYLVHGQLHWTLAHTIHPLVIVRAAILSSKMVTAQVAAAYCNAGTCNCLLIPASTCQSIWRAEPQHVIAGRNHAQPIAWLTGVTESHILLGEKSANIQIQGEDKVEPTPVLENCAFFTCVQCGHCGYLIVGGSATELLGEEEQHAIDCKATHGLIGAEPEGRRTEASGSPRNSR